MKKNIPNKIPNKLKEFEEKLLEQGKKPSNVKKYIHDSKVFLEYLDDKDFSEEVAAEYRDFLLSKYSKISVQSMLSCLNVYFDFLKIRYKFDQTSLQEQKVISSDTVLTKEEYNRLLDAAKEQNDERMFYIIETLCSTDLQVSELDLVTVEVLRYGCIKSDSYGKEKIIYLPSKLCRFLMDYSRSIGVESGSIFAPQSGDPFCRTYVNKRLKRLSEVANISEEKLFPKNLRRLYKQTRAELERDIVENMGLV